jgi:hypothetical protein
MRLRGRLANRIAMCIERTGKAFFPAHIGSMQHDRLMPVLHERGVQLCLAD